MTSLFSLIGNSYDQILLNWCKCHLSQMRNNVVFVSAFPPLPAQHRGKNSLCQGKTFTFPRPPDAVVNVDTCLSFVNSSSTDFLLGGDFCLHPAKLGEFVKLSNFCLLCQQTPKTRRRYKAMGQKMSTTI